MFNDYIIEKQKEKIEYDLNLFKEYLIIYLNLLIKYPSEYNIRFNLTNFIKEYYLYSKYEYKLLNRIKKINNITLEDKCIVILEDLESVFERQFNYNEDILNGYEEAIFDDDINRAIVMKNKPDSLNIINNYIKQLI